MLVSFDIFDTVLLRRCGSGENIFWLLAQKLYQRDTARRDDFFVWRRHIGEFTHETTLQDIYSKASDKFSPYTPDQLMVAELETESEQLVKNPSVLAMLMQHRAKGDSICFISDMYLPSVFLQKVLTREDCYQGSDLIFVSCEHNARKDRGTLYEVVCNQLQPKHWVHYGDNIHSDIRMAKKRKIEARHVDTCHSAIEQYLLNQSLQCRYPWELKTLVGLSRFYRLQHNNQAEFALASAYLAPVYVPYVIWLLKRACDSGIKRLYFLARDGWILHQIAKALGGTIECRELYVSRKALLLPWLSQHFSPEAFLEQQAHQTLIGRQVKHLLGQLKLTQESLSGFGISLGYSRISTLAQQTDFLNKLFDSKFTELLRKTANQERQRLLAYLHQEGFFDRNTASAMVDIGWFGSGRRMLNDFRTDEQLSQIPTYYLGVRRDVLPCRYGLYESFFPEGTLSTELTAVIENYLSAAPYPSTVDYKQVNGAWQPDWQEAVDSKLCPALIANDQVAGDMAKEVVNYDISEATFFQWARLTLHELVTLRATVNLTPLTELCDFDGQDFVRRLSLWETLKICFFGARITAWDNASLALSVGFTIKKILWPVHLRFAKLRQKVYLHLVRSLT